MDIKAQNLYSELQSLATQAQSITPEANPIQGGSSGQNFADMLSSAIGKVNSMQLHSKSQAMAFELGDPNLSLAEVMIAKEKAGIAFEATVQVRNKVLEAYKEIINMPV
ncbi:flagellar hook-basal body complex protein FliE [Alteromonadaceae bacterium M269]|nr:flagellar hook-basal body complex protein FliE [Alteromonadaceae bacterium M269]